MRSLFQRLKFQAPRLEHFQNRLFHQRAMKIVPIPVLEDNYSYLILDESTKEAAVVDPVEPDKVLPVVEQHDAELKSIITTHHHLDHSGGNEKLLEARPDLIVYGGSDRVSALNHMLNDKEEFRIGDIGVQALFTKCHTTDSVSYYLMDSSDKVVFTGDTLFIGGCGKFFEGTASDMHHSLNTILGGLPPETKVYCGHEYTASNLRFASSVDPNNQALTEKIAWVAENKQTVPSTIGEEKTFNPFMRVDTEAMKKATGKEDPIEVMGKLREMKNDFR